MFDDKRKKESYAPDYYNDFHCTADQCRHSCCIDWEICIDETTFVKYQEIETIRTTVTICEDGPCFSLTENGRCPHLNHDGLCNIILTYGENFLSDICKNHPRFFHEVTGGRIEAGLGIVCEEACRLILENEKPFSLSEIKESDEEIVFDHTVCEEQITEFDPLSKRDQIISIIETAEKSFDQTIDALKNVFGIPKIYTMDEWIERFLSLEILDTDWECTLQAMKDKKHEKKDRTHDKYEIYYVRLLTYFVYRHVSIAENERNLRARLAFALLSVEMIRYLFEAEPNPAFKHLIELARQYSAEIEYSEDNTFELIFEFERRLSVLS